MATVGEQPAQSGGRDVVALARDLLVLACASSAGVHAALTPEHLHERVAAGAGFLVSALVVGSLGVVLTLRPESRLAAHAAAAVLAGLVLAYALAVTTGLPVLHPDPEPVDGLGLATKAVELAGLAAALALAARSPADRLTRPRPKGTTT